MGNLLALRLVFQNRLLAAFCDMTIVRRVYRAGLLVISYYRIADVS